MFTSLYHHITDVDNLRACFHALKPNKTSGVDGMTKNEYGKDLEERLRDLSDRLGQMGYRPGPKLRVYIPKAGSDKGRPLGISNFEDKIVELAVKCKGDLRIVPEEGMVVVKVRGRVEILEVNSMLSLNSYGVCFYLNRLEGKWYMTGEWMQPID